MTAVNRSHMESMSARLGFDVGDHGTRSHVGVIDKSTSYGTVVPAVDVGGGCRRVRGRHGIDTSTLTRYSLDDRGSP